MKEETVRISFDVPIAEHIEYKTECVKSRIHIKDFMHHLVILGMDAYKKAQFKEKMSRSIQQAKEGKVRKVSSKELDQLEKYLENDTE